jgi:hypothetical protein
VNAICNLKSAIDEEFTMRWAACSLLIATAAALAAGCGWDGHFSLLGYTTQPNYDMSIRTVYVPIFKNDSFYKWREEDLTRYVIREIESKTPYKVVSSPLHADTELIGKIVNVNKQLINSNQVGEVRQAQVLIGAQIIWRDLRPGKVGDVLSAQRQGGAGAPPPGAPAQPTLVTAWGQFETELGGSITQAQADALNRLAVQVVSMMETWGPPAPVICP